MSRWPYAPCPVCGGPAHDRLTVRYRYPRPAPILEAVDPWGVHGSAPLSTCGSLACQAAGLLAVVDEVITTAAVEHGHLLDPADVEILGVRRPGDFTGIEVVDGADE